MGRTRRSIKPKDSKKKTNKGKEGKEEVQIDIEELENDTKIDKENFLHYFRRKRYFYLIIHQMTEQVM